MRFVISRITQPGDTTHVFHSKRKIIHYNPSIITLQLSLFVAQTKNKLQQLCADNVPSQAWSFNTSATGW